MTLFYHVSGDLSKMTEPVATTGAEAPSQDPFGAPMTQWFARRAPSLPAAAQRLEPFEDWLLDGAEKPHPAYQRTLQALAAELQRFESAQPGALVRANDDYAALTRSLAYTPTRRAMYILGIATVIEPDIVNRLLEWADKQGRSSCPAEAQTLVTRVGKAVGQQLYERMFGRPARRRVQRIIQQTETDHASDDDLF